MVVKLTQLEDLTDPEFAKRAREAVFHVKATSYEKHFLWEEHSSSWPEGRFRDAEWAGRDCHGYLITVGHINDHPVCLDILLDWIAGKTVLFYRTTSRMVDHTMIEEWFAANLPVPRTKSGHYGHANAMNFHHCLLAIKDG